MSNSTAIRFICSSCGYRARIPSKFDGKHIKCPSCKATELVSADDGPSTGSTVAIKRLDDGANQVEGKFRFVCTECGYRARIPTKYSGMAIKCPGCGAAQMAEAKSEDEEAPSGGNTVQITKVDVSGGKDVDKFRFQCGSCGYRAKLPNRFKYQNIKCPGCGTAQEAMPLDDSAPVTGDTMVLQLVEEVPAPSEEQSEPAVETTMADQSNGPDLAAGGGNGDFTLAEPEPEVPAVAEVLAEPEPETAAEETDEEEQETAADAPPVDPDAPLHFDPFADERKAEEDDEEASGAQDLLAELRGNRKRPPAQKQGSEEPRGNSSRRIAVPGAKKAEASAPPPPPPPPATQTAVTVDPVASNLVDAEDRKATVKDTSTDEPSGPVPAMSEDEDEAEPSILPGSGSHPALPPAEPANPPPPAPVEAANENAQASASGVNRVRRSVTGSGAQMVPELDKLQSGISRATTTRGAAAELEEPADKPAAKRPVNKTPPAPAKSGGKGGIIVLLLLLIAALVGGGYLYMEWQKELKRANGLDKALSDEKEKHEDTEQALKDEQADHAKTTTALGEKDKALTAELAAHELTTDAKNTLQQSLATAENQITELKDSVAAEVEKLGTMTDLRDAEKTAKETAEAKAAELQQQLDKIKEQLDELGKNADKFKTGGLSLKVAKDQAEADKRKAEKETEAVKKELKALQKEFDALKQAAGERNLKKWGLLGEED